MTNFRIMIALMFVLAGLTGYTTVRSEPPESDASESKVRVGTFDSRAIAIAYYNTAEHASYVEGLKAEHAKALAAGDKELVKELEAEGESSQELAHKQVFSTWPVDNILETLKERLPEIAKQADVDVIVSKWNIVYRGQQAELIDVTEAMVTLINPDEKTLEILEELKKQDPVPLEELEKHEH
jgi:hypothetical protein